MTTGKPDWQRKMERYMRDKQRREMDAEANRGALAWLGLVILLGVWAWAEAGFPT